METIFFFFQAEDGIRDRTVTGVQTCALPILGGDDPIHLIGKDLPGVVNEVTFRDASGLVRSARVPDVSTSMLAMLKIGRASCRERVYLEAGGGCGKKEMDI